jgi:hypothetical protein
MTTPKDFESLDYSGLVDLLGKLTKQYTSELVDEPGTIDDEKIYFINLLIKEIEIRENLILDQSDGTSLSF